MTLIDFFIFNTLNITIPKSIIITIVMTLIYIIYNVKIIDYIKSRKLEKIARISIHFLTVCAWCLMTYCIGMAIYIKYFIVVAH